MIGDALSRVRPVSWRVAGAAVPAALVCGGAAVMAALQPAVSLGFVSPGSDRLVNLAVVGVVFGASFAGTLGAFLRQRYVTEVAAYSCLVVGVCGYVFTLSVVTTLDGGVEVSGTLAPVIEGLVYGVGGAALWVPFLAGSYALARRVERFERRDPDVDERPLAEAARRVRRAAARYLTPGER